MLDVHVLTMDYTDPDIHQQCRQSIELAAARAGYEVRVHYVPGIYGHLGAARRRGYSLGNARYVTHVDDDDYVHPDAFSCLAPLLRRGVQAITTGESLVVNGCIVEHRPSNRHHLAVFDREAVRAQPYDRFRLLPDQFLLRQIPAVHISECVYYHRVDPESGSRRCRRERSELEREELTMLAQPELVAIEALSASQIQALYDKYVDETP
ncbi:MULTISPECIES: glycosyltransferase family A protein [Pseudoxanthomonas]|uniref:Glycosyltransferase 2-like domain-containing protein n=1 Tax=Pseudoxanthomonas winnipegensis TaxID=2480810 RepID=A0AAW8GEH0_9GAMM|nr:MULTISPECIES: glycosyltransferase family A protein [Pseudoxanthomonas]MDQ1120692.1 hypothetical protein [Pseudoxanthomonas winnipegensis]MDQ1133916.1 hypothetical protein [Pseudoxanthomonas winnipegensis]MDR6139849.1 hypothetical protein [Pseudoxanthomonas sp. SORGH_AS_0997]